MVTASPTQPCFAGQNTATQTSPIPAPRRSWKPDGDAHLIYQWVKMEGKSQGWVAQAFNVSQSTVSRIIQRYERWQAHVKEREEGRLDHAERLRAQRWLTFERNELIATSCLRIAHEMEGSIDASRSTVSRPMHQWSQEKELRSVHFTIDRTGMVSRFLRLAFKINMEQLKLAELDPPPQAQPLSEEELAEEERQAEADAAELAAARRRSREQAEAEPEPGSHAPPGNSSPDAPRPVSAPASTAEGGDAERGNESQNHGAESGEPDAEITPSLPPSVAPSLSAAQQPADSTTDHSPTHRSPASLHNLHNLHNENPPFFVANADKPCSCMQQPGAAKNSADSCITDCEQPPWPANDGVSGAHHAEATAAAGS